MLISLNRQSWGAFDLKDFRWLRFKQAFTKRRIYQGVKLRRANLLSTGFNGTFPLPHWSACFFHELTGTKSSSPTAILRSCSQVSLNKRISRELAKLLPSVSCFFPLSAFSVRFYLLFFLQPPCTRGLASRLAQTHYKKPEKSLPIEKPISNTRTHNSATTLTMPTRSALRIEVSAKPWYRNLLILWWSMSIILGVLSLGFSPVYQR